jgi:hypothetical protein
MIKMACALVAGGFTDDWRFQFSAMIDLVDKSTGKTWNDDGLTIQISSARTQQLECGNADMIDPKLAAEEYLLHQVLGQSSGIPDPSAVTGLTTIPTSTLIASSPFGCNQIDDLNCSDFYAVGQSANAHLAQCGDEDRLDQDGDGRACEKQ